MPPANLIQSAKCSLATAITTGISASSAHRLDNDYVLRWCRRSYSTAIMTSEALITTTTLAPTLMLKASAASLVIEEVTTSPISTFT